MIELTICYPPHLTQSLTVGPETTVSDLKLLLTARFPFFGGEELRLVCAGRVLQDHLSVSSQGVGDKSKIYVSVRKQPVQAEGQQQSRTTFPSAADSGNDPLMGPLIKFLSDNPELYQQMILNNPQMQKLIEKNPELGHALSDPSTLKSMLNAATNPRAYNEMLRGHDRAMSNLENIPEGFSHLKRIYSTLQEPMYDALSAKGSGVVGVKGTVNMSQDAVKRTTSEPVPNPWAPPPPPKKHPATAKSPIFGFKSSSHKRKFDGEDSTFSATSAALQSMQLASPKIQDHQDHFPAELEVMHKLGYLEDERENIPALRATGGRVSAAIDRILRERERELESESESE